MVDGADRSDHPGSAESGDASGRAEHESGGETASEARESRSRETRGSEAGESEGQTSEGQTSGDRESRKEESKDRERGTREDGLRSPSDDRFDEELPKYLREGLARQNVETLRIAHRYIDALIDRKDRPVVPEELPETAEPVNETTDGYVVEEYVRCGKDNCACASGAESDMHGPYEYRYYRDDDGSLHKEYADNE